MGCGFKADLASLGLPPTKMIPCCPPVFTGDLGATAVTTGGFGGLVVKVATGCLTTVLTAIGFSSAAGGGALAGTCLTGTSAKPAAGSQHGKPSSKAAINGERIFMARS